MPKFTMSIGVTRVYNVDIEAADDEAAAEKIRDLINEQGIEAMLETLDADACEMYNEQDVHIQCEESEDTEVVYSQGEFVKRERNQ